MSVAVENQSVRIAPVGHVLLSHDEAEELYSNIKYEWFRDMAPRLKVVKNDLDDEGVDGQVAVIDYAHPNLKGYSMEDDFQGDTGDAYCIITGRQIMDDIVDMSTTPCNWMVREHYHMLEDAIAGNDGDGDLTKLDKFLMNIFLIRALYVNTELNDDYMNTAAIREDIWKDGHMASRNEIAQSTCPDCFMVYSTSGGCNCS